MPADSGDKTEAPSPRRLREAKEKGQVAKSADLAAAAGLLTGLLLLHFYGSGILNNFMEVMRQFLTLNNTPITGYSAIMTGGRILLRCAVSILGPFFLIMVVVAIVVNLLQTGFIFTAQPLTPSLEKISPISGLKRLFSLRSAMRLTMGLAKVGVISTVAYFTIKSFLPSLVNLVGASFVEVVAGGAHMMYVLGLRMVMVLLVLAIADFAFQKYQMRKDLRMTKEEVKEEMKRMEGDPVMRQRRRNIARQLAAQRMSQAVPQADVVVTNPTHLAVALKYDSETMSAPKVIAKGADFMAKRIREIAIENKVPIVERKPLARALYKACDIGDYVPVELYKAVAEVLAYVYQLAGKTIRQPA